MEYKISDSNIAYIAHPIKSHSILCVFYDGKSSKKKQHQQKERKIETKSNIPRGRRKIETTTTMTVKLIENMSIGIFQFESFFFFYFFFGAALPITLNMVFIDVVLSLINFPYVCGASV